MYGLFENEEDSLLSVPVVSAYLMKCLG